MRRALIGSEKMVKTIRTYETSDGETFHTKKAAECHQSTINFKKWYSKHPLYYQFREYKVPVSEVLLWLSHNRMEIVNFLSLNNLTKNN